MDSTQTESSSMRIGETLRGAFIPLIAIIEVLINAISGCFSYGRRYNQIPNKANGYGYHELARLADESRFAVKEAEALYELFKKFSWSIIDDGLIHKEELQLALFKTPHGENLFIDQVFDLFEEKKNGVIEFDEFIHALTIFHIYASKEDKIDYSRSLVAFRFYDLRQTGFIEREQLKKMVVAILLESDMKLSDDLLDAISLTRDCKINKDEWKDFVGRNPALLKNMTLPYLKEITTAFPSFVFYSEVED